MRLSPEDKIFSEFKRKYAMAVTGGCERCLTPKYDIVKEDGSIFPAWKQLQCAHLLGRWKGSIRWDEENAVGLCGGCHLVLDRDHQEKENFIMSHLGQERYDLLKGRERVKGKPDKEAIRIYYKAKIKELEGVPT